MANFGINRFKRIVEKEEYRRQFIDYFLDVIILKTLMDFH